ncbi:SDR family NAD(P)-dependent oxidoreductase [Pseudonocardia sp. GCM10023141]|uniref:SDR family NAD(P)-dependent oxidoreductase n=1 Tax=Pseudonocardia sp. GCM10023141 TaxID=3252653 RepID=UPI00360D4627
MPGAVVIGAGPGIGRSVALRFARAGLPVAVIARSAATVRAVAADLAPSDVPVVALTADVSDEPGLRAALDKAAAEVGPPDVVVYNAAVIQWDVLGELSAAEQLQSWAVNVVGAITTAAHVAPGMAERGAGTFLITGGMPEPVPTYISLSLGKVAVRALVTMLDAQYRADGVHFASVTVGGPVATGTAYDPDEIAERYWQLHTQPRAEWVTEVRHG